MTCLLIQNNNVVLTRKSMKYFLQNTYFKD